MAIFDLFKRKEVVEPRRRKRAYTAASPSRLFADFGQSEASADAELYQALTKLRARSRDLARNNEYAKKYLTSLKNNVVGERGFNIQVKAQDSVGKLDQVGNQEIEKAFKSWGRKGNCTVDGRVSWIDAQKMAIEGVARDGEAFIIKHRGSSFKDSFSLEFIEPDQIDMTYSKPLDNGHEVRMGVELDKFKRPVAYYVLASHPGDATYRQPKEKKRQRISADRVIHVFLPLRAGQSRGEPWMAASMSAIKQLDGFREAAVVNARIGASKMGFFTSPAGDGFVADEMDGNVPIMSAEPGTFHQLPDGVDFTAFDPKFPSEEFDPFHKSVLKGIAAGLGISYTSLSNDLEATSYSSIRQGALEERDHYKNIQNFLIEHMIQPIFESWLEAAMEVGSISLPLRSYEKFRSATEYRGRAWSWVDPQKEMSAAILGLKSGVLSLQDVASQYGKDVEELLSQIQRDKALMEQFDVQYDLEPYNKPNVASRSDDEHESRELDDSLSLALQRCFSVDE